MVRNILALPTVIFLLFTLIGQSSSALEIRASDSTSSFFGSYCIACHDGPDSESGVNLVPLASGFSDGQEESDLAVWKSVIEQVVLGEMPPSGETQPHDQEKEQFIETSRAALRVVGHELELFDKLSSPEYGNLVNHQKLFSGEITERPYSPARLWRTSPNVFENVKREYGVNAEPFRQPFIVDDKSGIKDYASLLLADSAVVDVLLMNAGNCADQLLEQKAFQELLSSQATPSSEAFRGVLSQHFRRVVYRDPSPSELDGYLSLFQRSFDASQDEQGTRREAMRITLMAVMLHPESIYRIEIGLGESDGTGRRRLSSAETAFAIAYALTDKRPDAELMEAAKSRTLDNASVVRHQIERLLNDPQIDKPRLLRFFQEFFGYAHAHKVFKDEDRSGGFSYYGENYPDMYERDADFFVLDILDDDVDVFYRLLTSDRYFLLNRQTFRNTIYDFYLQNQAMIDADEFPKEKEQELLTRLDLDDWRQLNQKYYLHNFNRGFNGSTRAIKQIVKEVRQWKNTTDEYKLLHGMQPLYRKYPMVYDLEDNEQDFLQPQPYQRPNRAGMLTHPAWLIAHSLNDSTDPIRRGKWIQERLLAGRVPDIPITVDASIPEDHHKTLRERLLGTEQQECWRCHQKMNPLGYPFEMYDDFGRYRNKEILDKLPKVAGEHPDKPINAGGYLEGSGDDQLDGDVEDALDLIDRLSKSDLVRQSMIRHCFRYFLGRNEQLSDSLTLIEADRVYLRSGGSFQALLTSLLTSDSFLYRK